MSPCECRSAGRARRCWGRSDDARLSKSPSRPAGGPCASRTGRRASRPRRLAPRHAAFPPPTANPTAATGPAPGRGPSALARRGGSCDTETEDSPGHRIRSGAEFNGTVKAFSALAALALIVSWVAGCSKAPDQLRFRPGALSSESCRECHQTEYDQWRASHHALAERPIDFATDHKAFDPPHIFKAGSKTNEARLAGRLPDIDRWLYHQC